MIDLLAKLLASENLTIIRGSFDTASFDVIDRVIRLPDHLNLSHHQEILFAAHESSHAIHTDHRFIDEVKTRGYLFKQYLNVVEDVRIERLIKKQYPGLKKDFYLGYTQFAADDFFGIKNIDVANLSFVDRINIHYKIGHTQHVKFSAEELPLVEECFAVNTFEEVIALTQKIFEFAKQQKQEQENRKEEDDGTTTSEQDNDGDSQGDGGEEIPKRTLEVDVPITQENFDEELSARVVRSSSLFISPILLTPVERVNYTFLGKPTEIDKNLKMSVKRAASYLFREFETRKAAARFAKTTSNKSGSIDVSKLASYKTAHDIFKKYDVIPDDVNHGIVVIIDQSGSMGRSYASVLLETYTLMTFCNMAGIKYEIYGFKSSIGGSTYYGMQDCSYLRQESGFHTSGICGGDLKLTLFASSKTSFRQNENVFQDAIKYVRYARLGSSTPLVETLLELDRIIPTFKQKYNLEKVSLVTLTDGVGMNVTYRNELGFMPCSHVDNSFLSDGKTGKKYPIRDNVATVSNALMTRLKDNYKYLTTIGFFVLRDFDSRSYTNFISAYHPGVPYSEYLQFLKSQKKNDVIFAPAPGYDSMMMFKGTTITDDEPDFTDYGITHESTSSKMAQAFAKFTKASIANKVVLNQFVKTLA